MKIFSGMCEYIDAYYATSAYTPLAAEFTVPSSSETTRGNGQVRYRNPMISENITNGLSGHGQEA